MKVFGCLLLGTALALPLACSRSEPALVLPPLLLRQGDQISIPAESPLRQRLKVVPVVRQAVRPRLAAPASVEANPERLARIAPPLTGRVAQLMVRFGDAVRAGQPLLSMDAADMVAAQTDFIKAESTLAQAGRTLERQRDLTEHGIGARRELEQAQTDRDLAADELARARLRLQQLGNDGHSLGALLVIRSPIAGRVVEVNVAQGEVHNDASAPLMTIADLSWVWLTANVQEKDMHRVHVGDTASVVFAAYPQESRQGTVSSVADLLDVATRTVKVWVDFANADQRLKPGMFASATFIGPSIAELMVPTTALLLAGDKTYVFVETAPHTYRRQVVDSGEEIGPLSVVHGLDAQARVVAEDAVVLQ